MIDRVARPAAHDIPRKGVAAWLRSHADIAVRMVVAPPGFGKTTALATYARAASDRRRLYFPLDGRTTSLELGASIARALGDTRTIELAALLAASAPLEIVLDDVHLAGEELLATVNALVADPLPDVFFIVASQRRDVFAVGTLFARGFIAVCDQSELAFDAEDGAALFAAYRVGAGPAAIEALVARTEGWPAAIIGTVRELAREPQTVQAAYERWRGRSTVPTMDLVATLLERVPLAERAAARQHFADGSGLDQHTLAVLHRCGFFVRFEAGTFALMGWVDDLYPATRAAGAQRSPVLAVQLFGRFAATVGGVPIVWARRRDQHIVKYLLLHPSASASRAELAAVFWPQTARPLAMQNLRTACSTIRRAIGNVVGMQEVDHYFIAGETLVLNRAAIVCDVDRFRRHIELAGADDDAGSFNAALAHLRAAERLYGNGLFAGDVSEPAFFDDAQALAGAYAGVLARLSGALIERGSPDQARAYAAKAQKLRISGRGASRTDVHLRFAAS